MLDKNGKVLDSTGEYNPKTDTICLTTESTIFQALNLPTEVAATLCTGHGESHLAQVRRGDPPIPSKQHATIMLKALVSIYMIYCTKSKPTSCQ